MTKLHHRESDLQIRCVRWFRCAYPAFARLMEHPKNEGCGDRVRGAIAKAEGVQAGVADLILHVPSASYTWHGEPQEEPTMYFSLAVEMKTKTGRQSRDQKVFQLYFEAAGGCYTVVRSFEEFEARVKNYMSGVPEAVRQCVEETHAEMEREAIEAARAEYRKIIHKND